MADRRSALKLATAPLYAVCFGTKPQRDRSCQRIFAADRGTQEVEMNPSPYCDFSNHKGGLSE